MSTKRKQTEPVNGQPKTLTNLYGAFHDAVDHSSLLEMAEFIAMVKRICGAKIVQFVLDERERAKDLDSTIGDLIRISQINIP